MDGDLLERVVVGSGDIFATIARMFARYATEMQDWVLRYDEVDDHDDSGDYVHRDTDFF